MGFFEISGSARVSRAVLGVPPRTSSAPINQYSVSYSRVPSSRRDADWGSRDGCATQPVGKRGSVFLVIVLLFLSISGSRGNSAKGGDLGSRTNSEREHFTLAADKSWQLDTPGGIRFDASGLAISNGKLLTLSDRGPELFEIELGTNSATLKETPFFSRRALSEVAPQGQRYDCEGVTLDSGGNLYICEESHRAVFRSSPDGKKVSALRMDWAPVKHYFSRDSNASFEGIAIHGGTLYLANEREKARIIVVDLSSLKVLDSFFVDSDGFAFGGPHYSDLAFSDGHLFVLDRNHRCILEVNVEAKRVTAEYSFAAMELAPDVAYKTLYPTGTMEGLAIDKDYFWLVTDNNGLPRFKHPGDIRPTLFRCRRPER
jgi:uncharacterized protein YjiK